MSNPEAETWSLDSSVNRTVELHGRTYQQYALERGTTYSPVDDEERERLDKTHQVFQLVFDHRHIFPPIQNPRRILECGFGSGAWAVEVAERYPQCQVIGVDISPHMRPDEIPPNLWLQVDDLNEPFTFRKNDFDFIQSRGVVSGINKGRWPSYIQDCFRILRPGGWFQCVEVYANVQSDNGTITERHALRQLSNIYLRALEHTKDMRAPLRMDSLMRESGFVDLESRMIPLPMSSWPSSFYSRGLYFMIPKQATENMNHSPWKKVYDAREREIGEKLHRPVKDAIGSHSILPAVDNLGMSPEQVHVLVAQARHELENLSLKPYLGLYICIGRKPSR